ncbi:sentrin-specific protease 5 [Chanos chanos]|uniref:Sentrin-specific protease 5 n=1 Tax=Chanos chanos TaxID=29144 RepID=A0A6J2WSA3_CHACN|nr:sentrin-specific protease 5-like [Chanos chanos]
MVLVHNSSEPTVLPPAQMPEYGRSRRKRVPKSCDCCGPNSKPHSSGHDQVSKKRGRKKKELLVVNQVEVPAEVEVSSAVVDLVMAPKVDLETSSEMEMVTSPEAEIVTDKTLDQIWPSVSDTATAPNGTDTDICTEPGPTTQSHSQEQDPAMTVDSTEHNKTLQSESTEQEPATRSACMEQNSTVHTESIDPVEESINVEQDSSTHRDDMEIEDPAPLNRNVSALRDHGYCKSPWFQDPSGSKEGPSEGTELSEIDNEGIVDLIHEFLENFYEKYGSFIPLTESDVVEYLNQKLNADLKDSRKLINAEVTKYKDGLASAPMHYFKVTYNKHTLTLEDLSTLDDQNWVNDQVINMYGELIMEAANHKVHFFNSFFHRQLVAKGYEGVKRWTKKVDLFSKRLLLIPLHLEIHWSLITVDIAKQSINFYDSQGIMFKYAVDNILRYILAEAKEKKQTVFQKGWKMIVNKCIPQQKNDSDCGVFVLEYCKCLALTEPLQFTQEDMPRVRKRIYKELCECKLVV